MYDFSYNINNMSSLSATIKEEWSCQVTMPMLSHPHSPLCQSIKYRLPVFNSIALAGVSPNESWDGLQPIHVTSSHFNTSSQENPHFSIQLSYSISLPHAKPMAQFLFHTDCSLHLYSTFFCSALVCTMDCTLITTETKNRIMCSMINKIGVIQRLI